MQPRSDPEVNLLYHLSQKAQNGQKWSISVLLSSVCPPDDFSSDLLSQFLSKAFLTRVCVCVCGGGGEGGGGGGRKISKW